MASLSSPPISCALNETSESCKSFSANWTIYSFSRIDILPRLKPVGFQRPAGV
jgi:hypothetical protein